MFLTATVTKWQGGRFSGGRVSPKDNGHRQYILNTTYMHDIRTQGTGSRLYFTERESDSREGRAYLEITQSVDEIRTARDTVISKNITLPVFPKNNPARTATYVTIKSEYLIYADRDNSDPTGRSWVMIAENAFKTRANLALVDLSLEEILSTSSNLIDYDGNGYTTVVMGTQEWIVETLKVEHYSDGTVIPNITDDVLWIADLTGACCYYENDVANKSNLGVLYNWYAVTNIHGLAYFTRSGVQEVGWRIPTYADFQALATFVGGVDNGGDLKEVGFVHWEAPNFGATDLYGFKAISGGNRYIDTNLNHGFFGFKTYGDYWTDTESIDPNAYSGWLSANNGTMEWGNFGKLCGMNVRCVRDV